MHEKPSRHGCEPCLRLWYYKIFQNSILIIQRKADRKFFVFALRFFFSLRVNSTWVSVLVMTKDNVKHQDVRFTATPSMK